MLCTLMFVASNLFKCQTIVICKNCYLQIFKFMFNLCCLMSQGFYDHHFMYTWRNIKADNYIVQAEREPGTTIKVREFLDQNFIRNKNILGKKPKSWTHSQGGFFMGGQMLIRKKGPTKWPNNVNITLIVGSYGQFLKAQCTFQFCLCVGDQIHKLLRF